MPTCVLFGFDKTIWKYQRQEIALHGKHIDYSAAATWAIVKGSLFRGRVIWNRALLSIGGTVPRHVILWVAEIIVICATGSANAEDVQAGEKLFKKCLPCHSIGVNARNKFGPQLNGLDGRKIGSAPGYRFSSGYRNSDITWTEAIFSEYIFDPKSVIPNSKMTFVGLKNPADARDLWAYISSFDDEGNRR